MSIGTMKKNIDIPRNPSIHITLTQFTQILRIVLEEHLGDETDRFFYDLATQIFKRSKSHKLDHRKLLIPNKKITQKLDRGKDSSFEIASLFASLLVTVRKSKKHRGISPVREGTKDWIIIKEIAGLAQQFFKTNNYTSDFRNLLIDYITNALERMNKFNLYKLRSMHESICDSLLAQKELLQDKESDITINLHTLYNRIINERTGINYDYSKIPEKYIYFMKAKDEALRIGIEPKDYLIAQFEGMQFRNGIPDPLQLVGPKALERYTKYAYENGINRENKELKTAKIDFSKILNNG